MVRHSGRLSEEKCKADRAEDHVQAVECFTLLYALIDTMERGEEIVFADEYSSWMIPGDEKAFVQAYVTSLAAVETPDGFTMAALPLLQRDSYQSFATRAYTSAIRAANKQQSAALKAELKRQNTYGRQQELDTFAESFRPSGSKKLGKC